MQCSVNGSNPYFMNLCLTQPWQIDFWNVCLPNNLTVQSKLNSAFIILLFKAVLKGHSIWGFFWFC